MKIPNLSTNSLIFPYTIIQYVYITDTLPPFLLFKVAIYFNIFTRNGILKEFCLVFLSKFEPDASSRKVWSTFGFKT